MLRRLWNSSLGLGPQSEWILNTYTVCSLSCGKPREITFASDICSKVLYYRWLWQALRESKCWGWEQRGMKEWQEKGKRMARLEVKGRQRKLQSVLQDWAYHFCWNGRERKRRKAKVSQWAPQDGAHHHARKALSAAAARNRKSSHSLPVLLHRTLWARKRKCMPVSSRQLICRKKQQPKTNLKDQLKIKKSLPTPNVTIHGSTLQTNYPSPWVVEAFSCGGEIIVCIGL